MINKNPVVQELIDRIELVEVDSDKLIGNLIAGSANDQMKQFANAQLDGTGTLNTDANNLGTGDIIFRPTHEGKVFDVSKKWTYLWIQGIWSITYGRCYQSIQSTNAFFKEFSISFTDTFQRKWVEGALADISSVWQ